MDTRRSGGPNTEARNNPLYTLPIGDPDSSTLAVFGREESPQYISLLVALVVDRIEGLI